MVKGLGFRDKEEGRRV